MSKPAVQKDHSDSRRGEGLRGGALRRCRNIPKKEKGGSGGVTEEEWTQRHFRGTGAGLGDLTSACCSSLSVGRGR